MTHQRSLKKIVRERMASTGESYTTAYQRVTAWRSAESSAVPGYPAFGADQHGPSALTAHLLRQSGVEISEAMACGLGGGIGFLYAVFEYKAVPHPLVTIVAQHHPQPWLEAATEHLGIPLTTATSSAAGPALRKLDAALDNGRAALLTVGRGFLPWHDDVSPEEAADPYPIVVAAKRGGDYLVDDRSPEPQTIGADAIGAALAAHRKGRFGITTVVPVTEPPALADAVIRSITTTTTHLSGPVIGNAFDVNFGLSGMKKFAGELRDQTTKSGWTTRFASDDAFRVGMGRVADCLSWDHTGPGGTRTLYADFLDEAAALGLPLTDAAAIARDAGERWAEIADSAAEADPSNRGEVLELIADRVDGVIEVEERLLDALVAALG